MATRSTVPEREASTRTAAPCGCEGTQARRWTAGVGWVFVPIGACAVFAGASASSARQVSPGGTQLAGASALSGVVRDAESGQPLGEVTIGLLPRGGRGGRGAAIPAMKTDEYGRFVFPKLEPGTYALRAMKAGYADQQYGPAVMGAVSGTMVLARDEWLKVELVMSRLGAIAGRVTDDRGKPVPRAYVRLLKEVMVGGRPQIATGPLTTTDDRGEYRLGDLEPGRYIVSLPSVQHSIPSAESGADLESLSPEQRAALGPQPEPGKPQPARPALGVVRDGPAALVVGSYPTPPGSGDGRRLVYSPVFYSGTSSFATASPVDLGKGEERSGVDIVLRPVPSFRVSGRVAGNLTDYSGIVLRLMPEGLEDMGVGSEVATTLVKADGTFTFLGVPAGAYTLVAPGSSFEFVLQRAQAGATTSPVGAVSMPATPGLGRIGQGGSGGLVASAPGITYASVVPNGVLEKGFARFPVVVRDRDVRDVQVPLQPAGALTCRLVYEGGSGAPPSGLLQLTPADGGPQLGVHNGVVQPGEPDLLRFKGLLPGAYAIRKVGMQGFTVKSVTSGGVDFTRRPLDVAAGSDETVVITLTRDGITLTGVVRDRSGAPVPLATVILFPTDQRLWSQYGFTPSWILASPGRSNGTYELSGVQAGEYFAVAVSADRANAWADPAFLKRAAASADRVTLAWGDKRALDLRLGDR